MIRRVTLCGARQGPESLVPLLFEISATPFFRTREKGQKSEIPILSYIKMIDIVFYVFEREKYDGIG